MARRRASAFGKISATSKIGHCAHLALEVGIDHGWSPRDMTCVTMGPRPQKPLQLQASFAAGGCRGSGDLSIHTLRENEVA